MPAFRPGLWANLTSLLHMTRLSVIPRLVEVKTTVRFHEAQVASRVRSPLRQTCFERWRS